MLTTHIYFNGDCKDAIELYKSAFGATVQTFFEEDASHFVVHAEIMIHGELLMLNDFGDNDGVSKSGGYQLSVRFNNEDDLKSAYAVMRIDSIIISPMQPADYSPCAVRFIDKFGVRWAFWV